MGHSLTELTELLTRKLELADQRQREVIAHSKGTGIDPTIITAQSFVLEHGRPTPAAHGRRAYESERVGRASRTPRTCPWSALTYLRRGVRPGSNLVLTTPSITPGASMRRGKL